MDWPADYLSRELRELRERQRANMMMRVNSDEAQSNQ